MQGLVHVSSSPQWKVKILTAYASKQASTIGSFAHERRSAAQEKDSMFPYLCILLTIHTLVYISMMNLRQSDSRIAIGWEARIKI